MKKEEKRIRTLSLQQLYEELGYLEDDLKSAKHRQHEKHIEQLVEGDVSDKRILKDILWITGGFATFHTMYIFLARPIQNPVWLNYLCAGACAIATAMSIYATRKGWEKTNAKYGEQFKKYYQFHPEEVEAKKKDLARYDEDIAVENLEKKIAIYNKYIEIKRAGEISPSDKEAMNEYFGKY